jgi:hypothetical protein
LKRNHLATLGGSSPRKLEMDFSIIREEENLAFESYQNFVYWRCYCTIEKNFTNRICVYKSQQFLALWKTWVSWVRPTSLKWLLFTWALSRVTRWVCEKIAQITYSPTHFFAETITHYSAKKSHKT